jgi:phenylalanyl-tRNA synthetase beta chain
MLLEAKGVVETILGKLAITNSQYYFSDKYSKGEFETQKISKTIIYIYDQSEELLGYITSVNDKTKVEYKIKNDQKNPLVVISEIDLEKLFKLVQKSIDFKAIPKFPSSIRDISVMVAKKVLVNDVMMDIQSLKIDDLRDIDIFDIYEAEGQSGQKSLSFHLIFRNEERTLEANEIEKYLELIKQNLINKGYIIR